MHMAAKTLKGISNMTAAFGQAPLRHHWLNDFTLLKEKKSDYFNKKY